VLGVKERKLEEMMSPKRKIEEMMSSKRTALANILRSSAHARVMPASSPKLSSNDAAKAPPLKKTVRGGGRKRLAIEERRFYVIGCAVDERFRKFEPAFRLMRELKAINRNWNLNTLRSRLSKLDFDPREIDAVLQARTPRGAAKRFVAQSLASRKNPNGLSLQTINSCYSRYLKAVKA
jgi:hypothetical protein